MNEISSIKNLKNKIESITENTNPNKTLNTFLGDTDLNRGLFPKVTPKT